jgi:hypothetical protein
VFHKIYDFGHSTHEFMTTTHISLPISSSASGGTFKIKIKNQWNSTIPSHLLASQRH